MKKVSCPGCNGKGELLTPTPCPDCGGEKVLTSEEARAVKEWLAPYRDPPCSTANDTNDIAFISGTDNYGDPEHIHGQN